jgi:hypothetical protein
MGGIYEERRSDGMDSGVMIYKPNFMKIGSGIRKFIMRDSHTNRQQGDLISLLLFFQNKESRVQMLYISSLA